MPKGEIEVHADGLCVGGGSCGYAADAARRAANRLDDAPVGSGIFGDFADAHSFYNALRAAHQNHQKQLHADHSTLTGLSQKANTAATMFTNTDESVAGQIDSAADGIG